MITIGIDLGGTNVRAATFEAGSWKPVDHVKEVVGDRRDPAAMVERIADHVQRLARGQPATVGIGIAAMLRDRIGTVANSPALRWHDVPFGTLLANRLGLQFQVGVYNDVNAIVWGESVAGAARGCRDVLGVYVGTGIGGGVIAGGQLVEGVSNCAGEIGHVKVRWDDTAVNCGCGQRGCVEAYCGGSYLLERIHAELRRGARSSVVKLAGSIDAVTPGHVDSAAGEGDPWALNLWTEIAPLLAVALGNAVAVLNPERLILGGGVLSRTPTLYALVTTALMLAAPVASTERLSIVPAELGDDAGMVGAASLASTGVSIVPRA